MPKGQSFYLKYKAHKTQDEDKSKIKKKQQNTTQET